MEAQSSVSSLTAQKTKASLGCTRPHRKTKQKRQPLVIVVQTQLVRQMISFKPDSSHSRQHL
ncbi:hypothetical protein I79_024563 [Cricetulus griseus]|uniref:Uncharacterized protein n=1 Tax=Cricetulus griseus TaxID=10029 RepID=G3IL05_CRIGR|nr:hypothetical protein I79_024563 [Cricetulus griseus]